MKIPDHPVIAETERFGYIRGKEYDEDAYEAYCDRCYEEKRDNEPD